MSKIKLCNIVSTLVFLFCLSLACVTSAQVTLTQQEVNELGMELTIAKTSIQNSREQIKQSKLKLEKALSDLEVQKQNLIVQSAQLNAANKSLELLNQEHKKKIHKLSRQRNFAYTFGAICLAIAVRK